MLKENDRKISSKKEAPSEAAAAGRKSKAAEKRTANEAIEKVKAGDPKLTAAEPVKEDPPKAKAAKTAKKEPSKEKTVKAAKKDSPKAKAVKTVKKKPSKPAAEVVKEEPPKAEGRSSGNCQRRTAEG